MKQYLITAYITDTGTDDTLNQICMCADKYGGTYIGYEEGVLFYRFPPGSYKESISPFLPWALEYGATTVSLTEYPDA